MPRGNRRFLADRGRGVSLPGVSLRGNQRIVPAGGGFVFLENRKGGRRWFHQRPPLVFARTAVMALLARRFVIVPEFLQAFAIAWTLFFSYQGEHFGGRKCPSASRTLGQDSNARWVVNWECWWFQVGDSTCTGMGESLIPDSRNGGFTGFLGGVVCQE